VPSHTNRTFTDGVRHSAFKFGASSCNRVLMKLVCFELRGWEWIFLSSWGGVCVIQCVGHVAVGELLYC